MANNDSGLVTVSDDSRPLTRRNGNGKLSAGSVAAIVLGTLAGAAVVGTAIGLLVPYFANKNQNKNQNGNDNSSDDDSGKESQDQSWTTFDYSKSADLNNNFFGYVAYAFYSPTPDAVPTLPPDYISIVRLIGAPTSCGTINFEPEIDLPVSPPTVTGLYVIVAKNYASGSSGNCQPFQSINPTATFVPNNDPNAASRTASLLKNIISTKPPLALLVSWGDATNILTNHSVVELLKKLRSAAIRNVHSYQQGSGYIFSYQPSADPSVRTVDMLVNKQNFMLENITPIQPPS